MVRSIMAGMIIGLASILMLWVKADGGNAVLCGLCFSTGLFGVMASSSRLFTGLAGDICKVLEKQLSLKEWALSLVETYFYNWVGTIFVSLLAFLANVVPDVAVTVAQAKLSAGWFAIFWRAVLCNVCIVLAVLYNSESKSLTDTALACIFPVVTFVTCGFEHSIADMCLLAVGGLDLASYITAILVVTLGNLVGGLLTGRLIYSVRRERSQS